MQDEDAFEQRLSFGCGFVAGAVIAAVEILYYFNGVSFWSAVVILAIALVCGFLALHGGATFWDLLIQFLSS